ncbi:hypothetical protein FRC08_007441 [Ceratobasidium sp. 394]|nr:hypothetical protein FRC08_007441 [Ceratobasidium sp. 394]
MPTRSAAGLVDLSTAALPPAARLVPTQAVRVAALHAVTHLRDANAILLACVQGLETATAKAQTDDAACMRILQAEAACPTWPSERANEGPWTEAEHEQEKLRGHGTSESLWSDTKKRKYQPMYDTQMAKCLLSPLSLGFPRSALVLPLGLSVPPTPP